MLRYLNPWLLLCAAIFLLFESLFISSSQKITITSASALSWIFFIVSLMLISDMKIAFCLISFFKACISSPLVCLNIKSIS
ncbi:putative membrane protein [Campylobacter coli]|nr:putative membrane protein [Campylobacter coli]